MSLDLGPKPIRLRGGGSRHPQRQGRRVLFIAGGLVAFVLVVGWLAGGSDVTPPAAAHPSSSGDVIEQVIEPGEPEIFATFEDLALWTPTGQLLIVAYHEAAFDDALPVQPLGRLRDNFNSTEFTNPGDTPGPLYDIQASRGRTQLATTAIDLVMRDDDPVLSPVSGTVTEVRPYQLYGRHPDTRIEIAPAGRPDLRIVLIHVADVRITVGSELVGGETVIAGTANRFPFHSQVDRHVLDGPWPHVHLEVKRAE